MIVRIIDLETASDAPGEPGHKPHAICEIAMLDYNTDTDTVLGCYTTLVNPGTPIPPAFSAVHHIVNEDVREMPGIEDVLDFMSDTYGLPDAHVAHRAEFEESWLAPIRLRYNRNKIPWICTWRCAVALSPDEDSHSNQALRYSFRERGWDALHLSPAHRALPDCHTTLLHLRRYLRTSSAQALIDISQNPVLIPKVLFGKYYGKPWKDMDVGFLDWVLKQDFDEDVKHTARYWKGQRREKPVEPFHEMRP